MKAEEFKEFKENESEEKVQAYFDSLLFKTFNIMVKGKFEYFNGEMRMRYFAVKVFPHNVQAENRALLRRLDMYKTLIRWAYVPAEGADKMLDSADCESEEEHLTMMESLDPEWSTTVNFLVYLPAHFLITTIFLQFPLYISSSLICSLFLSRYSLPFDC